MAALRPIASNVERLRAGIDRGRAGDKVRALDPAAAPLGADDEAAGTSPSREEIAAAEREELGRPPMDGPEGRDIGTLLARSAQMLAAIVVPAALLWLLFS